MELVCYVESECRALFNADEMVPPIPQDKSIGEPQVLSLGNICMIDGSWTSTSQFSGCGWDWMDSLEKVQTYGDTKLPTARVCIAFGSGNTTMANGEYAPTFNMTEFWEGLQGFDRDDYGAPCLAKLCNIIGEDKDSANMLSRFQDCSYSTSAKLYF